MQLIKRIKIVPVDDNMYLMLNGITGAIDLIDESVYELYLQWKDRTDLTIEENSEMYNNFLNRGYLLKPGEEEKKIQAIFDTLDQGLKKLRSKVDPTFLLTYNCNFRCSYCFEKNILSKGREQIQRRMTPEMVNGFFKYFAENNMTVGQITLYGGEPLLLSNEDTVNTILAHAREKDVPINIVTNGYTLDYYAPILSTAKIKNIQVTLDGDRDRHNATRYLINGNGTFNQILVGLKRAKEYNLPITVRCNIDVDEDGQVQKLLNSLESYGLKEDSNLHLYIAPVAKEENKNKCSHEFLAQYLQQIDQYVDNPLVMKSVLKNIHHIAVNFLDQSKWQPKFIYCAAHLSQQIFDPWGSIYPCQILVGEKENAIGTFDEKGAIRYNENYKQWQERTVKNIKECHDCTMALFCGGGCAMRGFQKHGDITKANCDSTHELWEVFLPYLYERYLK